jgi:hypothetical protein
MAQNVLANKLARFFSNGFPQVGLEVGTDAGLEPQHYIHIPRSLAKAWAYREVVAGAYERKADDTTATLAGKTGWTVVPATDNSITAHAVCRDGATSWFVTPTSSASGARTVVDAIYVDAHTLDDLRRFILANEGHVREDSIRPDDVRWVHAVRFWGVATGLVVSSKNREYVTVDDPVGDLSSVDDTATFVIDFAENALTAAAARATSWRRSSHATGGNTAQGFPQRWLSQNKFWPEGASSTDAALSEARARVTTAFYVATHAIAVHPVLALMAPADEGHWASVTPKWGLTFTWDVLTSTAVRIAPKTQVAGTAMVVDAMVVFKLLLSAGIAPLLENFSEWRALHMQYKTVEEGGVRVASYAQWFLDGHPDGVRKENFNQKSSECANLIGELAAAATSYFAKSTIAASPALRNASIQLASETSKDLWNALARERRSAGQDAAVKAYQRVVGASAADAVVKMSSSDRDVVMEAVEDYNTALRNAASEVGLRNVPQLDKDAVYPESGSEESGSEA